MGPGSRAAQRRCAPLCSARPG